MGVNGNSYSNQAETIRKDRTDGIPLFIVH
jgi:hypothetical protein